MHKVNVSACTISLNRTSVGVGPGARATALVCPQAVCASHGPDRTPTKRGSWVAMDVEGLQLFVLRWPHWPITVLGHQMCLECPRRSAPLLCGVQHGGFPAE